MFIFKYLIDNIIELNNKLLIINKYKNIHKNKNKNKHDLLHISNENLLKYLTDNNIKNCEIIYCLNNKYGNDNIYKYLIYNNIEIIPIKLLKILYL